MGRSSPLLAGAAGLTLLITGFAALMGGIVFGMGFPANLRVAEPVLCPEGTVRSVVSVEERSTIEGETMVSGLWRVDARGVRAEHAFVPEALWVQGRGAFLRSLLAADRVYLSDWGRDRWEAAARRNLERELQGMS